MIGGVSILDEVRLLGDPFLRRRSDAVLDVKAPTFQTRVARLHEALAAFRERHGFGRAISAPQLGMGERFIACNLGDGPFTLINPAIRWRSPQRFTLWDDCMSHPELLVRVERHASICLEWTDERGIAHTWERLAQAESELFQHEIDHLDGVLFLDHLSPLKRRMLLKKWQKMRKGQTGYLKEVSPASARR